MVALIIGIVLIAFCVFACLPSGIGLAWGGDIVRFLKGFAPVLAAFIGLIAVFIGFAAGCLFLCLWKLLQTINRLKDASSVWFSRTWRSTR